ncbi:MAG TPA: hypothetical protein VNA20_16690 [Frankiaceae bacterium]|nr:hypothetical protein [Frankiaceae bacterium]
MTHDDVRAALVSGEPVPAAAREHLNRCDACLAFAQGLDRARRAAPMLVPAAPPAGLADRVLGAVLAAPAGAASDDVSDEVVTPLHPVLPGGRGRAPRPFHQRALIRVAVAVAATLVVGAAAFVLRDAEDPTPEVVLAAAARRTAEAGTAKVRVEGTTTFVVPVAQDPKTPPDYASVPESLRAHVEEQWRSVMAAFAEAMRLAQEQIDNALGQIDDVIGGFTGSYPPRGQRPSQPPRPARPLPSQPSLPESIRTTVTLRASGDVSFTDRLRLNGTVGVDTEADLDVVAGRDVVAVRTEGSSWAVAEAKAGPLSTVIGGPDALLRAVGSADDVTAVVEGRRYSFRVVIPDGTTLSGEADLDDAGMLTAVRLTGSGRNGIPGAGTSWHTDLRVRLSDPGAPVAPEPVDVADVRARLAEPDAASRVLYPLGAGVRAAVAR